MKVKVLRGFVGTVDGVKYRPQEGDVIDMPKGADWIKAGLAEKVPAVRRTTRKKASK